MTRKVSPSPSGSSLLGSFLTSERFIGMKLLSITIGIPVLSSTSLNSSREKYPSSPSKPRTKPKNKPCSGSNSIGYQYQLDSGWYIRQLTIGSSTCSCEYKGGSCSAISLG